MLLSRVFNKLVTVACACGPSTGTLEGDRSRGSSVQGYLGLCGFQKRTHEQLARYLALLLALFSFLPSYIRKYNAVLSYKEKYIKQRMLLFFSLSSPSSLSRVPCSRDGLGFSMYLEIALN